MARARQARARNRFVPAVGAARACAIAVAALAVGGPGCGGDGGQPVDAAVDAVVVEPDAGGCVASASARRLFLNAGGGTYHYGYPDDPATNTTSTLDGSPTIAPWSNVASLSAVEACLGWMLADFDLALTDVDPGAAPHLEVVLSGTPPTELGLDPNLWATGPVSCTATWHEIQWVFPGPMADDPAAICELIAYTVGRSIGLDVVTGCGDIMAEHIFQPTCSGTFTDEARTCSNVCGCTRLPTQSSRAAMLAYFGPCPR